MPRISGKLILTSGIGILVLTIPCGFTLGELAQIGHRHDNPLLMLFLLIPLVSAILLAFAGERTLRKSRLLKTSA
jgi:hypothetical protein